MPEKYFCPGDYIVTKEGFRGYVVDYCDMKEKFYTIRLTSGYIQKSVEDLEKDPIMENN
jgi:hypothetical protein